jgi:hypothetical protein
MTKDSVFHRLGIAVEDGLLKSGNETVRIRDIRRVQIEGGLTLLGYAMAITQFTELRIALVVHGSFGRAVLSEREFFNSLWFRGNANTVRLQYDDAKAAVERLVAEHTGD